MNLIGTSDIIPINRVNSDEFEAYVKQRWLIQREQDKEILRNIKLKEAYNRAMKGVI